VTNRPEPQKPDDTATKALLAFLEKQNDRLADELKELRKVQTAPPPPQPTILQQMKELKPVVSEFAEMFAQQTGGNAPWWQGPLEKLMESVPDVIDLVKTGQQHSHQQQPAAWTPNPGSPNTQVQPVAQIAQPAQATVVTGGAPAAAELTDEQKQAQAMQALFQKWGPFVLYVAPHMVEKFKLDEDGRGGLHFRDWFLRMHGELKWTDMRRELGPETFALMIEQHPQLSLDVSPPDDRMAFVEDFFSDLEEEDSDRGEDGTIKIGGDDAA
jgi:hypothetical protein